MKKPLFIILAVIILAGAVVVFFRFGLGGDEDAWICQKGQWVKRGNPSSAKPTTGCGSAVNTSASANANLAGPKVTYTTYTNHGPQYVFDIIEEWISIAPAEIQKSITEEQRNGYEIVYYSSSPDQATLAVSEKTSANLTSIAEIVADDRSVAQGQGNVTVVGERLGQTDARTEMTVVSGVSQYTVYSRYLLVSSGAGETRWALLEVVVPTSRTEQYRTVVSHLLDSLKLARSGVMN